MPRGAKPVALSRTPSLVEPKLSAPLGRGASPQPPSARLHEDLGFDSFRLVEALVCIEQGHADLPDAPPTIVTLGDAHEYHRRLAGALEDPR